LIDDNLYRGLKVLKPYATQTRRDVMTEHRLPVDVGNVPLWEGIGPIYVRLNFLSMRLDSDFV
jgi:hypothetical protein